jgi:hypothetical protein
MMLAIAIILGIAMVLNVRETEGNYNVLMAAALCVSLYPLNIAVFSVTVILLGIIGISYYLRNN